MKERLISLRNKYQKFIMPIALIGGFVVDIFTLNRIDQFFDNAILITHLVIVFTTMGMLFKRGPLFGKYVLSPQRRAWIETLMVFSFGALFSGFIIFYTRSGSLITSWPFLFAMIALMLATEFRKKYFQRLSLQIVVLYLALLSWITFFLPVVIKKIGPWVFVSGVLISLACMFGFLLVLRKSNRESFQKYQQQIILAITSIAILFVGLYFTRIIPPIPLSMKYDAVYYDIERLYPGYAAQYEKTAWYNIFRKRSRDIHWRSGEDIFVFTQIFAPTRLETTIDHNWQWYNEAERSWENRDSISISISGGRADGYRGFSRKSQLEYGLWRVKTTTLNGQVLGFTRFEVQPYDGSLREIVTEQL